MPPKHKLSFQIRLKKIIKDLSEISGTTVLVSSHDLIHVTEVCERIVVLDKGVIVRDIKTSEATLKELETYFSGEQIPEEIRLSAESETEEARTDNLE